MAIVLTGFGPFGEHATNASWEAVRLVPELWGSARPPVRVEEIPVEYGAVQARPAAAWREALFTVHVGVSGRDKEVTLECRAHNSGYCRPDTGDSCPERGLCVEGGEEEAATCLDMAGLLEEVRAEAAGEDGVEFQLSQDAGRYLCDFVYYRALHCRYCTAVLSTSSCYTAPQRGPRAVCARPPAGGALHRGPARPGDRARAQGNCQGRR
jgi:pyroglutamyl-peptidase